MTDWKPGTEEQRSNRAKRFYSANDEKTFQQAQKLTTADGQPFDPFRFEPYYLVENGTVKEVHFRFLVKCIEEGCVKVLRSSTPGVEIEPHSYLVSRLYSQLPEV